jgi:hypothetical protein
MMPLNSYETHVQCDCGGTLIVIATPDDNLLAQSLDDENFNVWKYEEVLTFKHRGEFTNRCLEFKNEVVKLMQEDTLRRTQGLLGRFISREIHG